MAINILCLHLYLLFILTSISHDAFEKQYFPTKYLPPCLKNQVHDNYNKDCLQFLQINSMHLGDYMIFIRIFLLFLSCKDLNSTDQLNSQAFSIYISQNHRWKDYARRRSKYIHE